MRGYHVISYGCACTGVYIRMKRTGYPWHSENRENGKKKSVNTQGILFAQVVNSLMLKVMDVGIFAAKISFFFLQKLNRSAKSVLCM